VATLLFVVVAVQFALMALFARSPIWRAGGFSALVSLAVVYLLWQATDGAQTRTEAWLVLTSLPLIGLGAVAWKQALGKLALGLGVVLTAALLLTWRWAALGNDADPTAAIIIYASLVLVAMVALFMIAGVLGMRWLVERSRDAQSARDRTA
jgi:hypothetical protein